MFTGVANIQMGGYGEYGGIPVTGGTTMRWLHYAAGGTTLCGTYHRPLCTGLIYHSLWQNGTAGGAIFCEEQNNTGAVAGNTCVYTSPSSGFQSGYENERCAMCSWYSKDGPY